MKNQNQRKIRTSREQKVMKGIESEVSEVNKRIRGSR